MTSALGISLVLSSFLIAGLPVFASGSSGSGGGAPILSVRVYNNALVARDTLSFAEEETSRVFLQAGIAITWIHCGPDEQPHPACNEPLSPSVLIMRLFRGAKLARRGLYSFCCGFAIRPQNGLGGTYATIFYDCAQEIARGTHLPEDVVLGHLLAHEIGHLMLSSPTHAQSGIMRDRLNGKDWQLAARGLLLFTEEQIADMRAAILARNGQEERLQVAWSPRAK